MKENISDNFSITNIKDIKQKGINEKQFLYNIALIYDILKELEKEWDNKNIYNERDKSKIHSLFSLLYFELNFFQQIYKINILNQVNKNQNDPLFNNIINYNKEMLSKKIEQFLLITNDRNLDLYNNYIQCTYNNNDNNIKKIISKFNNKSSCLKTKYKNFIKNTKNLNNTELNKKNNINKNKMNSKGLYESIYKNNILNKSGTKIISNKKKVINNRNNSLDKIKTVKSNNEIKSIILDRIKYSKNVNQENNKYLKKDKKNKTINNFNKKSNEIKINKSKENFSNNDISLFSSCDEKENNPIRKVKNIIIKVRNKNITMDCNNCHTNNEKDSKIEINKKENNKLNAKNDYKIMSKSGYLLSFCPEKDKTKPDENIRNNFYHKERETKEILYDCMTQIQKKLNSSEKYNKEKKFN